MPVQPHRQQNIGVYGINCKGGEGGGRRSKWLWPACVQACFHSFRLIQYNTVSFLFLFYKIFLLIIYIYYIPIYKISKGIYDLNSKVS